MQNSERPEGAGRDVQSAVIGGNRSLAALEPAHWPASTLDTTMILPNPIVSITIGLVRHALAKSGPDRLWGNCRSLARTHYAGTTLRENLNS
jgi:hypothetical protein